MCQMIVLIENKRNSVDGIFFQPFFKNLEAWPLAVFRFVAFYAS